jgi:hypothetical protein
VEICLLLEEGKQKETEHYHRFLYRVMNFMEQYEWFHISSFLWVEVERFKKTLVNNAFYNNCPGKDSAKISDGSGKGIEKEYEAKFSGNHESVDRRAELCKPSEKIFSQLPVGLMKGDEKIYANNISGDSKRSELTVTELRDFLNELIDAGYGDYDVEADTQEGSSYSVRNEVLAFDLSKTIRII